MPICFVLVALLAQPEPGPPAPTQLFADLDGDGTREDVRFFAAADGQRGFLVRDGDGAGTSPIYPAYKAEAARFSAGEAIVLGVWTRKGVRAGEPARRTLWVVGFEGGRWVERWRGSALARPFTDFALRDLDGDGVDELVVHECEAGARTGFAAYRWNGFGFSGVARLAAPCEGARIRWDELRLEGDRLWRS